MSIKNLLEPDTVDEQWSHLYCDALTTKNLDVVGSRSYNDIAPGDFQFTLGNGAVPITTSLYQEITEDVVNLNVSASFINTNAPVNVVGLSVIGLILTLPNDIEFPGPETTLMTGSVTGLINDTALGNIFPLSGRVYKPALAGDDEVYIELVVGGDISAPLAQRQLVINLALTYTRAIDV